MKLGLELTPIKEAARKRLKEDFLAELGLSGLHSFLFFSFSFSVMQRNAEIFSIPIDPV